jgi:hypothetical protein
LVRSGTASLSSDIGASLSRASLVALGTVGDSTQLFVTGSGRGYREYFEARCSKSGCTPEYTRTAMYYQLSDGSWANMVRIDTADGTSETTWTNTSGQTIRAPVFPN